MNTDMSRKTPCCGGRRLWLTRECRLDVVINFGRGRPGSADGRRLKAELPCYLQYFGGDNRAGCATDT